MDVALISVDSRIPNLALMKVAAYHKRRGDKVKLFEPLFDRPDLIYASKVFNFTPDYPYFPDGVETIRGGTGYDLATELPAEVETMCPDYEIFGCDYAMGFTSRGCIRRCDFCIVPEKEGGIRAVSDIYSFWRGQERVRLLDNNLTALPQHFERICKQLIKEQVKVDFSQGLDIRLLTPEMARLLAQVRLWKRIHFAFDSPHMESQVRRGIEILTGAGIHPDKLTFYVLIGYDTIPAEDLYRAELLRGLGVNPFVMPFDKRDPYQRRFARWVNHKAIFKSVSWSEYGRSQPAKGHGRQAGLLREGWSNGRRE